MTRVALLWHLHQPFYQDLVTGEHILPWVRMHALKDYYGMAALLREFPRVKATFNLVPSLLVQLEAFAEDRAQDRALAVSLTPADRLTPADVALMRSHFFHAQRQRMIDPYPRYAELLARRDDNYTVDDLRDLQVWHKLVWIDPFYLDGDSRVRALIAKGRNYTEDDKAALRAVELEILRRVVPEYRDGVARGQIEVSASPFYHPILPLLCDTDVYLRTHPQARRPRHPFARPEDAAAQLELAAGYHARVFGRRPRGLWPSEGSVSDAMVPLAARAGFQWMATDELILARTLGATFSRDGHGHLEQPERLYLPYIVRTGGASIACAFRDHVLSDLIGFTYAGWSADSAADDFVGRIVEAGRRFRARSSGGGDAFIPIILDGENAWEHFEGGGRPFLRALYGRLERHPELRTVTMSEGCADAVEELPGIFPGSWIDANFYIWIGHADDQRAWSQVADARDALAEAEASASAAPQTNLAAAREEVLIAEGSDWCWWYGDDHSSEHDQAFDELFRLHLRNAYRLMGRPIPDELYETNISTLPVTGHAAQIEPSMLIAPSIDGLETSYFEWLGAGLYEVPTTTGAMHQADRRPPRIAAIRFGCDRERLFVRIDGPEPIQDLLADGCQVTVKFNGTGGSVLTVRTDVGRLSVSGPGTAVVAVGRVLEASVQLDELGVAAGHPMALVVTVSDASGAEIERHPAHRPIQLVTPDATFESRNWRA
jgi:alpha-amylase/alpha-mannosidase (GH57 family)